MCKKGRAGRQRQRNRETLFKRDRETHSKSQRCGRGDEECEDPRKRSGESRNGKRGRAKNGKSHSGHFCLIFPH